MVDQQKQKQLLNYLDRGLVMIHLDPRVEGVDVPSQFRGDPVLRLNLAYGFNLPALNVGEDLVYAVLSFNRQDYGCTIPWEAIFAMTLPHEDQEGVVWPTSVPPELATLAQAEGAEALTEPEAAPEKPRFALLDGGQEARDESPSPASRAHLKIVKG